MEKKKIKLILEYETEIEEDNDNFIIPLPNDFVISGDMVKINVLT